MAKDRAWDKLFDERGVDLTTSCVVPTCTTVVTRRAGICSMHWRALTDEERAAIHEASKADQRDEWIGLVRKAATRLSEVGA